jgi:hypothetical protein
MMGPAFEEGKTADLFEKPVRIPPLDCVSDEVCQLLAGPLRKYEGTPLDEGMCGG